MTHAIISYDDSGNDRDALTLGRALGDAGAELTLAYVRHTVLGCPDREQAAHREAAALLERGAQWLDDPYVERRVVLSGSTSAGLHWLAGELEADVIVFGSEYRTRRGHVAIGGSADVLLDNGSVAVALAPAQYATDAREIDTIGVLRGTADEAAIETAFALADRHGAAVVDRDRGVDLIVAGSRREAREGRVLLSASARNAIEEATAPVLVVARGVPLYFETLVTA